MVARMRRALTESGNPPKLLIWIVKLLVMLACCAAILSLSACKNHLEGILDPRGLIAYHERKLFFDTLALMLIVVLPVIVMSITFVFHYQSSRG